MSNSSLVPLFNLEIPGFAGTPWLGVVWRAVARASEITDQRMHIPEINADWQRLHRFEYNHFYNAWMGVASRFRACGVHSENFTAPTGCATRLLLGVNRLLNHCRSPHAPKGGGSCWPAESWDSLRDALLEKDGPT